MNKLMSFKDIKDGIVSTLSFMTIYQVAKESDETDLRKALPFMPLAGLAIGLVLYAAAEFMSYYDLSASLAALLLTILLLAQTRFLHLDGIADVADAALGAYTIERRREILKDSHIGAFGATALILSILAYYLLIRAVLDIQASSLLIAVVMLARVTVALAAQFGKKTSAPGLGAKMLSPLKGEEILLLALQSALAISFLIPVFYLGAIPIVILALFFMAIIPLALSKLFDGISGDILGASIVLSELFIMLLLAWSF